MIFDSGTAWKRAFDILKTVGVTVIKKSVPKTSPCGEWQATVTMSSYAGDDCNKLQSEPVLRHMRDLCFPESSRPAKDNGEPDVANPSFDQACWDGYHRNVAVWDKYNPCWDLLQVLDMNPQQKSSELRTLAMLFLDKLAAYKKTCHVYPHMLAAHVPEQIAALDVDPYYSQTQALEHKHQTPKEDGRRLIVGLTPGPAESIVIASYERLVFSKSTGKMEVQTVPEHRTTVKTVSRNDQLMMLATAREGVRNAVVTAEEELAMEKKALHKQRKQKNAEILKMQRDLDKLKI